MIPCPGFVIRHAQAEDVDTLYELLLLLQDHLEASNTHVWRMTEQARAHLRSQVAARVRSPDVCALVAEHHADGLVGCAFARIVVNTRYEPARAGVVDQLFVRPDHRRKGLASRLVDGACRFFAAEQVTDVSLRFVVGNEEAAGFWAACGFVPRIVTTGANLCDVESRFREVLTE